MTSHGDNDEPPYQQSDDDSLWSKVTANITPHISSRYRDPLGSASVKPAKPKSKNALKSQPPSAKTADKALSSQPHVADLRLGQRSGIDGQSARRLHQGRFDIEAHLDLHGMTQHQAHLRLNDFILTAARKGLRHVLVITGKGRDGPGILRTNVPQWLKSPPLATHINAIEQAQPKDGGGGALYIRLRRQRQDK